MSQETCAHDVASTRIIDTIHIIRKDSWQWIPMYVVILRHISNLEASSQFHLDFTHSDLRTVCTSRPRLRFRGGFGLGEVVLENIRPIVEGFGSPARGCKSGDRYVADRSLIEPPRTVSRVLGNYIHARASKHYSLPYVIFPGTDGKKGQLKDERGSPVTTSFV